MSLFSSKKSTTNYSTTNNLTDQSANAAEGGVAVGAGANVSITTSDPAVATAALREGSATAQAALDANRDVSGYALATNRDVSLASLATTERLSEMTANTLFGLADVASRERSDVLNTTTRALDTQRGVTDQLAALASGALERSQTPDSQVTKTLLYVVGGVALLFGLFALRGRRS